MKVGLEDLIIIVLAIIFLSAIAGLVFLATTIPVVTELTP